VGFGLNGRNLARVLSETGIKYVVVELNPETVKTESLKGEKIIFGDSSKEDILNRVNIKKSAIIVFAISDPQTTRRSLLLAKRLNPNVYSIVRTRYTSEIQDLIALGADEVIPEEFETSLQIFSKVLRRFHIPLNVIMKQVSILRGESYSMMVKEESSTHALINLNEILAAGLTDTFFIDDDSNFIGKSLSDINLRAKTGATIIAIVRDGKTITNPSGGETLDLHDTIVITGTHQAVDEAFDYLNAKST
jgi:CPA2 family monovalent cation:H+ antiporter-2